MKKVVFLLVVVTTVIVIGIYAFILRLKCDKMCYPDYTFQCTPGKTICGVTKITSVYEKGIK